jgi:hypothetical protein
LYALNLSALKVPLFSHFSHHLLLLEPHPPPPNKKKNTSKYKKNPKKLREGSHQPASVFYFECEHSLHVKITQNCLAIKKELSYKKE